MMNVECHVCLESMVQDRKVLALRCGHACCAPCLTRWLDICKQGNRRCPACRYIPEFGEVPRPVLLRFIEGNASRTRAPVNLDDAIKNAMGLKALVTRLLNAEHLTTLEFQTTLADALNIHVATQDLDHVRELKEVMSGSLAYRAAMKNDLSESHDKLSAAKLQLEEQKMAEEMLQQRLEHKEQQIQTLGIALADQKREYESRLDVSGATANRLREKVVALEATSAVERRTLRRELIISGRSIIALEDSLDKIKASILKCTNKILEKDLLGADYNRSGLKHAAETDISAAAALPSAGTVEITPPPGGAASVEPLPPSVFSAAESVPPSRIRRSLAETAAALEPDKHLLPEAPNKASKISHPAVPLVEASSKSPPIDWTILLNKPISLETISDISTSLSSSKPPPKTPEIPKPWTSLLNSSAIRPRCATAFFVYYSGLPSTPTITMETKLNLSSSSGKFQATVTLDGREISGIGDSAKMARRTCAMKIWEIVRKSDVAKWEEFVQAPVAMKFW